MEAHAAFLVLDTEKKNEFFCNFSKLDVVVLCSRNLEIFTEEKL